MRLKRGAEQDLIHPACSLGAYFTFALSFFSLQRTLDLIHDPLPPSLENCLASYKNTLTPASLQKCLKKLTVTEGGFGLGFAATVHIMVLLPPGFLWLWLSECPPATPQVVGLCCSQKWEVRTTQGPLTRKHNKRRRTKPSRVKMQMRIIAQNWSSAKAK